MRELLQLYIMPACEMTKNREVRRQLPGDPSPGGRRFPYVCLARGAHMCVPELRRSLGHDSPAFTGISHSGWPSVFVKKVLMGHSRTPLATHCLWLLLSDSRRVQ